MNVISKTEKKHDFFSRFKNGNPICSLESASEKSIYAKRKSRNVGQYTHECTLLTTVSS